MSHVIRCGQCGQRAMTNDGEEGTHALLGLDSQDLAALTGALEERDDELAQARDALWECVTITGADVSDGPPRPGTGDAPQLAELAVREVTQLRAELDETADENHVLRGEVDAIVRGQMLPTARRGVELAQRYAEALVAISEVLDSERVWPQGAIARVRRILADIKVGS